MDMKIMKHGIGSKGEEVTFHKWEFVCALKHKVFLKIYKLNLKKQKHQSFFAEES
jgi:hypothetical protein